MIRPKPCPFCGGRHKVIAHGAYLPPSLLIPWVECLDCGGHTRFYKTPELAIEAWNRGEAVAGKREGYSCQ